MRKIIGSLFIVAMFTNTLSALDATSVEDKPEHILAEKIVETLKVANLNTKEAVDLIEPGLANFLENGWFYEYSSNATLSSTKVENSSVQYVDVTISNNNRVTTCTYIYFPEKKQIHVIRKQFVPAGKKLILDKFEEMKTDKEYDQDNETDNYAIYSKKGTTERTTYLVKDSSAMVVYSELFLYDLGEVK